MVNLTNYFVGPAGAEMKIESKATFIWPVIGHGKYKTFDSKEVEFNGQVKISPFYDGPFDLKLTVTGDSTCDLDLNGHSQNAKYSVKDGYLNIQIQSGPEMGIVTIGIWKGGTYIDPEIAGGHIIWIGQ